MDQHGGKHRVRCIEVPFITEPQDQPDLSKVYELFPSLPRGCLNRPNAEVGLLLGKNTNSLLPTGGMGKHKVGNLRVCKTLLGKHGFVLEGYHPDIWRSEVRKPKIQLLSKVSKLDAAVPEEIFPKLSDM